MEEFLTGPEVSIFGALVDDHYLILCPARDYKRLKEGDAGPNTGGMGAVASRRLVEPEMLERIEKEIVAPTVAGLKKDGYKLYVATSKPEPYSVKIIGHFGLAEYFEMVGGADMNETRVHKGDVIRYVMESCNLTNPDEIVMIGDRENDMNGAKQNGIESVGVLYGYGSREELENAGACHIANDVQELGRVLRTL